MAGNDWIKTNWYCVRHALVPESVHNGTFYGGQDVDCKPCDELSSWNSKHLPNDDTVLITSALKRTHQTANAIETAGLKMPKRIEVADFNEQSFGDWEGQPFENVYKETDKTFWYAPAHNRISGGESFADLFSRVSHQMHELTHKHSGKNIISVTHGGTIRAMLAFAMDMPLDNALNVTIDNQSITLIEHFHKVKSNDKGKWRVRFINKLPFEGTGL
ncbi:MAG: histidine phosphatase family protein [Alphaproteobacteria bacterium]